MIIAYFLNDDMVDACNVIRLIKIWCLISISLLAVFAANANYPEFRVLLLSVYLSRGTHGPQTHLAAAKSVVHEIEY